MAYRSNCLNYAVGKWWREGGYVLVRRSFIAKECGIESLWHPASWVPHFLHRTKDHVITQFVPTKAQRDRNYKRGIWPTLFISWLTLWWHEGEIVGDDLPIAVFECRVTGDARMMR
jgi:hypothetical protein